MRREPDVTEQPTEQTTELEVADACLLCGGTLALRVIGGSAATYCRTCHWISRPRLHRHEDHVALVHTARLVA